MAVSDAGSDLIGADADIEADALKGCERWEGLQALGDAPILIDQVLPGDAPCSWFRRHGASGAIIAAPVALIGLPFRVVLFVAADRRAVTGADYQGGLSRVRGFAQMAALHMRPAATFVGCAIYDRDYRDLRSIMRTIPSHSRPIALVDEKAVILAANAGFAKIHQREGADLVGENLKGLPPPAARAFHELAVRPRASGADSLAVFLMSPSRKERLIDIVRYPGPSGGGPTFLLRAESIAFSESDDETAFDPTSGPGAAADSFKPLETFLRSTLIRRPNFRSRGDVQYVALNAWRAQVKDVQIEALVAIKTNPSMAFLESIAQDFAAAVRRLGGGGNFDVVVPVPSSHGAAQDGFSERLGCAVAAKIGARYLPALAIPRSKGRSHPKKNAMRMPMRCDVDLRGRNVLVVDDVVTSGSHLEEASKLIRAGAKMTFAMAWVGTAQPTQKGRSGRARKPPKTP